MSNSMDKYYNFVGAAVAAADAVVEIRRREELDEK